MPLLDVEVPVADADLSNGADCHCIPVPGPNPWLNALTTLAVVAPNVNVLEPLFPDATIAHHCVMSLHGPLLHEVELSCSGPIIFVQVLPRLSLMVCV